jgi:putative transposase
VRAFALIVLRTLSGYTGCRRFNSDQGSQLTSRDFIDVLKAHGVAISMDGRGRALDNIFVERLWRTVKYEDVYLKGYDSMTDLTLGAVDNSHW